MNSIQTGLLEDLFHKQRQYVNYFFDHLDFEQVQRVLDQCLQCKGLVILTGIGKSGIIAEKIAMTLVSTGTRALYLPAANVLHGDIGAIHKEDVVMMLSKSGQTEELLELIPHVKEKGCRSIAVVSEEGSTLGTEADFCVVLPVEKELCPFDLAPTTSTAVQLLFGDVLAMALMQENGFSLEQYAGNHPSGAIGKKVKKAVRDLMKTGEQLPFCGPKDRLVDVIVELSNKQCGCLLVVLEGRLLGVFTDGDLRRGLQKDGPQVMEKRMEELMNCTPIVVAPGDLAYLAKMRMQDKRYVMVAPVIENEKVIGLIRMHDIIHGGI
ncbi:MAG: Arabinose 5-phosphate isomerase KdsD [Chlamydiae bacterium]|nr:Arabinose 5-phosphate isomerase KdsD [Chlamydiota bacterium]